MGYIQTAIEAEAPHEIVNLEKNEYILRYTQSILLYLD